MYSQVVRNKQRPILNLKILKQGDTSQKGDWSNYRNEFYAKAP